MRRRVRMLLAMAGALVATTTFITPVAGRAAVIGDSPPDPGIPAYDHVFTIVLENENFSDSWTKTPAPDPYLRSLRDDGAFVENYYGVSHVSAGNYIAMTSGQPALSPLFNTDCIPSWAACEAYEKAFNPESGGARSIADQVEDSGKTWKAYMDGMDVPCKHPAQNQFPDPYQTGYATRHNPFVYYPPVVEHPARCNSHVVGYENLAADLASEATTPNYAFIVPDTCHDGHDTPCTFPGTGDRSGGLVSADDWLSKEVPNILSSDAFTKTKSLLIITFDENGFSDVNGCCSSGGAMGGKIGLVALDGGTHIAAGTVVPTTSTYDHFSYLRTVEDALGIGEHLNQAGLPTTRPMTDLFTQ